MVCAQSFSQAGRPKSAGAGYSRGPLRPALGQHCAGAGLQKERWLNEVDDRKQNRGSRQACRCWLTASSRGLRSSASRRRAFIVPHEIERCGASRESAPT